eukprot:14505179-Alexandrium_andersonii.AAC.1
MTVDADADFAGCVAARCSTCGGAALWGMRAIKHWPATQKTIAVSSGEAELAGIVKGEAGGTGPVSVSQDRG